MQARNQTTDFATTRQGSSTPLPSWIRDMLIAVVAFPATHGRGAGAKATAAGSHAVAWRMSFGTETVGFLKLAIFGLRAIEHPPRAVALTTEFIVVHASAAGDPLRVGVLLPRLRSFRVAGWGWVAEIGGCIAGRAHAFEKSGPGFVDTRTYRFCR